MRSEIKIKYHLTSYIAFFGDVFVTSLFFILFLPGSHLFSATYYLHGLWVEEDLIWDELCVIFGRLWAFHANFDRQIIF